MSMAVTAGQDNLSPAPGFGAGFTARDLVRSLFYYRRAIVVAFIVPLVLGLVGAMFIHPTYTATARLLVLPGQQYAYRPEVGNAAQVTLNQGQFVQTELAILRDTSLDRDVLRKLGPGYVLGHYNPKAPNAMEQAVSSFAGGLSFIDEPTSNIITVTYKNAHPQVAARALSELLKLYLARRPLVFRRATPARLLAERDSFAARLQAADTALTDFGAAHGITDLPAQTALLVRQREDLRALAATQAQQVATARARAGALRDQLAHTPKMILAEIDSQRSVASQKQSEALAQLVSQEQDMQRRYQPQSPQLLDIQARIATARAGLAGVARLSGSGDRQARNPLYDSLAAQLAGEETQLQGLVAGQRQLAAERAALRARLGTLATTAETYRRLQRTRDVLEQTYQAFSRNAEEATVNDALDRGGFANVRVVQEPVPPTSGSSLRKVAAAGGMVLGLVAAFAIVTVLSALRQVVIDRPDAERRLGLPVLLAVSMRGPPPDSGWRFLARLGRWRRPRPGLGAAA